MIRFSAQGPRVVVGIDGSECSRDALVFAAGEARMRGIPLHVVTTYRPEIVGPAIVEVIDHREDFAAMLRETLAKCAGQLAGLEVHADVVLAHPALCLEAASRDATLLVVGSRGHGGLARMVLGSTSHAVVQHASCPVVVVHRAPVPAEPHAVPDQRMGSDVIDVLSL
ncbi:MAG: universal stress protein [Frankiaceae bacterium]